MKLYYQYFTNRISKNKESRLSHTRFPTFLVTIITQIIDAIDNISTEWDKDSDAWKVASIAQLNNADETTSTTEQETMKQWKVQRYCSRIIIHVTQNGEYNYFSWCLVCLRFTWQIIGPKYPRVVTQVWEASDQRWKIQQLGHGAMAGFQISAFYGLTLIPTWG